MVKTGFSEVIGSWKIMEISPAADPWHLARTGAGGPGREEDLARSIRPGGPRAARMERAVTDLPQPDSPTSAQRLAPAYTSKSIPSTAVTVPSMVPNRV